MKEIYLSYIKSLTRLKEILQAEKTIANRDSSIKRFEFTTEIAWKLIQVFLREQKIICRSPKECLREAYAFGLITDDERWLQMIDDRNMTVHTYNETTADEVYSRLPQYLELFESLQSKIVV
ncbi:MAG: HI0074 family nucleotidyltransferase substrate-binding subunit [Bacteroidota bacterium]|nr:HI0074 family nucleotidyltransferase substrate-binding subunit [Bacteroidota bacterium]